MSEMISRFKNGAEKLRRGLATGKDVGSFVVGGAIELVAQDPKMNELAHNPDLQNEQRRLAAIASMHSRALRGRDIVNGARSEDEKIDVYSLKPEDIMFLRDTALIIGFHEMGVKPYEVGVILAVHDIDNEQFINNSRLNQE